MPSPLATVSRHVSPVQTNSFNTGNASPLNSGWYVALPNRSDFIALVALAERRLRGRWDERGGWGQTLPGGSAENRSAADSARLSTTADHHEHTYERT